MRSRFGRRKVLRTAGVATMLTTSVLAISGCDFTNWRAIPEGGTIRYINVSVKRNFSDQLIFRCTGNPGPGRDRAGCVLDTIRALCNGFSVDLYPWTAGDCVGATNSGDPYRRLDMEGAMQAVISPYAECLAVIYGVDAHDYNWYGENGGFCNTDWED